MKYDFETAGVNPKATIKILEQRKVDGWDFLYCHPIVLMGNNRCILYFKKDDPNP